ncbi:MAG: hypothetical protein WAO61_02810 [Solirubrobacterales bacterium]
MSRRPHPGRVWSTAPPGGNRARREILVAGRSAPDTASRNRGGHVRRLLQSRAYVWTFALLAAGAFLAAAAIGNLLWALVAPVAVGLVVGLVAFAKAAEHARLDFFAGFANSHGLTYTHSLELLEVTPLLGAGDRRRCDHYMEGPISAELPALHAGLALYTYEDRSHRKTRGGRIVEAWTPSRFTVCVVELQRAITTFPGVFLSQRRGLLGRIAGSTWLDYDDLEPIELESAGIASRYELHVRPAQNRTRLIELFQPSFQVWLDALPMPLYFEYSGGTLVTYVPKHLSDAASLEFLLQSTASIAERILAEGEPLQVVPDRHKQSAAPPPAHPLVSGPAGAPLPGAGDNATALPAGTAPPLIRPVPDLPPGPSTGLPPNPPSAAG